MSCRHDSRPLLQALQVLLLLLLLLQVLTTGSWPTQASAKCVLPAELEVACEMFRSFYLSAHSGRRLSWQTNMGTADLKATFGSKKHEITVGGPPGGGEEGVRDVPCELPEQWTPGLLLSLLALLGNLQVVVVFVSGPTCDCNCSVLSWLWVGVQVSTYQMVILLLFNDAQQLSYREIAEATEIPAADLKRSLQSLACAKGENLGGAGGERVGGDRSSLGSAARGDDDGGDDDAL
jgi:hypothetical protein